MKKTIILLSLFLLFIPIAYAGTYGAGTYGTGIYNIGQASSSPESIKSAASSITYGGVISSSYSTQEPGVVVTRNVVSKEYAEPAKFIFFLPDGSMHSIVVESVDYEKQQAVLTISSNPVTVVFNVGDSKIFDLNENGFFDTEIKLNAVSGNNRFAQVSVNSLNDKLGLKPLKKRKETVQDIQKTSTSKTFKTPDLTDYNARNKITGRFVEPDQPNIPEQPNIIYNYRSYNRRSDAITEEMLKNLLMTLFIFITGVLLLVIFYGIKKYQVKL